MNASVQHSISTSAQYLLARWGATPRIGIITGSGFQYTSDRARLESIVPYSDIPGLLVGSVVGHASRIELRTFDGQAIVVCSGRLHPYEGHSDAECLQLVDLLSALGVSTVVITNAAGGLHWRYRSGDVAVITDTIDLTFLGPQPTASMNANRNDKSRQLQSLIIDACSRNMLELETGTYCQLTGPSYETRAEIKMLRKVGADLVGMSTVREIRYAQSIGMVVAAFSMVTNTLSETVHRSVTHDEVLDVAAAAGDHLSRIIDTTLSECLP